RGNSCPARAVVVGGDASLACPGRAPALARKVRIIRGPTMRLVTVLSATLLLAAPALAQSPAPAPPDAAPVQSAAPTAKPAVPPVTEPAPRPETMGQDSLDDVSYACEGDSALQVVFINTASGNSYAIVQDQDRMIPMQVAVSASGARYL